MPSIKDLEKRVRYLEAVLDAVLDQMEAEAIDEEDERPSPEDTEWIWNIGKARTAAEALSRAFDWDDCPDTPEDFASWTDLHHWLNVEISNLSEGE